MKRCVFEHTSRDHDNLSPEPLAEPPSVPQPEPEPIPSPIKDPESLKILQRIEQERSEIALRRQALEKQEQKLRGQTEPKAKSVKIEPKPNIISLDDKREKKPRLSSVGKAIPILAVPSVSIPTTLTSLVSPEGTSLSPTLTAIFFSGTVAGYQTICGANKPTNQEPIVPINDGALFGITFEKGDGVILTAPSTRILIVKHNIVGPTLIAPPAEADIMANILITNEASITGAGNFAIKPNESGLTANFDSPAKVSWVIGPAGNTYQRGDNIEIYSDQDLTNYNFTLYL